MPFKKFFERFSEEPKLTPEEKYQLDDLWSNLKVVSNAFLANDQKLNDSVLKTCGDIIDKINKLSLPRHKQLVEEAINSIEAYKKGDYAPMVDIRTKIEQLEK